MVLRAVIVDDEAPARDELRYLLETIGGVTVCGEANCGEDAVNLVRELEPDLVFLDILLDDRDGFSVARELSAGGRPLLVVFATAYNQYATEAFEINAVDYVLKPFARERVAATLQRVAQVRAAKYALPDSSWKEKDKRLNRIPAYAGHRLHLLEPDDILFCCVEGGDVLITTGKGRFKANWSLQELQARLEDGYFYRTHRAFLVNLQKVHQVIPWFKGTYKLVMPGGLEVPVSRVFVRGLKEMLNIGDCRFGCRT